MGRDVAPVRILGIDPGSLNCGYALILASGKNLQLVDHGVLAFHKTPAFFPRLGEAARSANRLLKQLWPDEVALESLIYGKSPSALIKLAQTRGAMVGVFGQHRPHLVFEYAPNTVKAAVSGDGHASKDALKKTLSLMFSGAQFAGHDASDAAAIAVCHAFHRSAKMTSSKAPQGERHVGLY